ncbi:heavy metal-responsive transcriptional regulator [Kangiella sp. HD9-110m-PIT-SAG07]|nr:heavy metal-responsive transcriptional regulator [Kangiella sp. HD9-110m-PIT-SAG07]
MNRLKIGDLAKSCNVSIDTVRYYERKSLITPVSRSDSGYREYDSHSTQRLHFIRKAQNLGFTLKEIGNLLNLSEMPEKTCDDIRQQAQQKIYEIEERIDELRQLKAALGELADYCPGKGKSLDECSILKYLYKEES